ncbi:MAG: 50S ribosome-binding GTPase [Clostridia bacterium]|nr:50S ribosome-binding GTPase [Clostridia bacterium]
MGRVILVGNPNTGKTTLYNTLTGASEKASNWHGVTVEIKARKIEQTDHVLYDLPGIYSLDCFSPEEKISVDFLLKNKDKLIVNICDANNLKRNLYLTLSLIENGFKNIALAINMAKEVDNINR